MRVFVYGTLLQGQERDEALAESDYLGPALLQADLFDLGPCPGIREGTGEVVGEVYDVSAATLERLDQIEGYDAARPDQSLFLRQRATARWFADGGWTEVPAYFFGSPVEADDRIGHGDFRRHRLEQTPGRQWVLSFGSNLSISRLEERVDSWPEHRAGWLPGFELVFNKAGSGGNVYANCRYTGTGSCPAVAYALTPDQATELDCYEGGYLRVGIPFETEAGRQVVQAYVAHPDNVLAESLPGRDYQAHLEAGYREHELPWACLDNALQRAG